MRSIFYLKLKNNILGISVLLLLSVLVLSIWGKQYFPHANIIIVVLFPFGLFFFIEGLSGKNVKKMRTSEETQKIIKDLVESSSESVLIASNHLDCHFYGDIIQTISEKIKKGVKFLILCEKKPDDQIYDELKKIKKENFQLFISKKQLPFHFLMVDNKGLRIERNHTSFQLAETNTYIKNPSLALDYVNKIFALNLENAERII